MNPPIMPFIYGLLAAQFLIAIAVSAWLWRGIRQTPEGEQENG